MPGRRLARWALRRGARRTLGRSNAWLALGGLSWLLRRARRMARSSGGAVHREILEPGSTLLVTVLDPGDNPREHVD